MIWLLNWWLYTILAVSVFVGCLLLNYIVKKINEVQLDERLTLLQLRSPAGQVTQIQGPPLGAGQTSFPLEDVRKPAVLAIAKHDKMKLSVLAKSDAGNIETKPMFLGSIYYSDRIEPVPASRNEKEEINKDIVNDVLERAMASISKSKLQTVVSHDETLENKDIVEKSEVVILNAEVPNNENVNVIAMSDLSEHV